MSHQGTYSYFVSAAPLWLPSPLLQQTTLQELQRGKMHVCSLVPYASAVPIQLRGKWEAGNVPKAQAGLPSTVSQGSSVLHIQQGPPTSSSLLGGVQHVEDTEKSVCPAS